MLRRQCSELAGLLTEKRQEKMNRKIRLKLSEFGDGSFCRSITTFKNASFLISRNQHLIVFFAFSE